MSCARHACRIARSHGFERISGREASSMAATNSDSHSRSPSPPCHRSSRCPIVRPGSSLAIQAPGKNSGLCELLHKGVCSARLKPHHGPAKRPNLIRRQERSEDRLRPDRRRRRRRPARFRLPAADLSRPAWRAERGPMLMGMSGTEPGSGRLLKICLNFP